LIVESEEIALKEIELRLISELVKNSRRSDRELAKALGVSQPTVSRIRIRLEKQGLIEYTAIPNWAKLGFEIVAVVFGKRDHQKCPEMNLQKSLDFVKRHPNVIYAATGNGLGYDRITVSVHRDYSDYAKYVHDLKAEWGEITFSESYLTSLKNDKVIRAFSLKDLAEHLKKEEG
jgi:DNA-binding Lrp family transcriptional regulator